MSRFHVNNWHTLDIIIAELSAIFYWFNPGIWLMKRAIRENIEFITDREIIKSGADTKQYQYSLVSVSFAASPNSIFNHFNISAIKKRIIMMNAKRSSKFTLSHYAVLVPAVVAMLFVFGISKAAFIKKAVSIKRNAPFITPVKLAEKPIQKQNFKVSSFKKKIAVINVHLSADTQSKSNIAVNQQNKKVIDSIFKTNVIVDKNGGINITRSGESIRPLLYIVDGKLMKTYDPGKLNKANIKGIDIGETADKKAVLYIKTKNGETMPSVLSIRVNAAFTRHMQGKLIDGRIAIIDTVKVINRPLILDTTYFTKSKASPLRSGPMNAKLITALAWSKLNLQIKPELRFHAQDSVVTKRNGDIIFYGKAEVIYGTTNLKADHIEYYKQSNTIKAKGSVVFTQKQNNETVTSTASDFLWQLNKQNN